MNGTKVVYVNEMGKLISGITKKRVDRWKANGKNFFWSLVSAPWYRMSIRLAK